MSGHIAFGRVYPERASFDLRRREVSSSDFEMTFQIHNSQVVVEATPPEDINIWTFRNLILSKVESQVDIYGFLEGRSYSVEITTIYPPEGDPITFETEIPRLLDILEENESTKVHDMILEIFANGEPEYLRRAFRDLRLGINDPGETGFACYRAVESFRKHIHELEDIPDDKEHRPEAWSKVHELIGTEKEDIIEIQHSYAKERRHGGWTPVSDEERGDILETTYDAIFKYIQFCYKELV